MFKFVNFIAWLRLCKTHAAGYIKKVPCISFSSLYFPSLGAWGNLTQRLEGGL